MPTNGHAPMLPQKSQLLEDATRADRAHRLRIGRHDDNNDITAETELKDVVPKRVV